MTKRRAKHALFALLLLAGMLLLGGCVNQMSEREMADLSGMDIQAPVPAPLEDGVEDSEWTVTLYFLEQDGTTLRPVTRRITAEGGVSRAQAALDALLAGPLKEEKAFWPDLGQSRSERMLEVSSGVATVDLPAYTRTLPQQTMYAVRLAIASTLTEFSEISYVNVLVGGREEGLDLAATLPVGTFTRVEELDADARYQRLNEQRLGGEGVTLMTTLYFPAADSDLILPEARSVAYAQVSPIEYLYTLLGELGKGGNHALCAVRVPAPLEYIEEMPEIVRTEDGYLAVELRFDTGLLEALVMESIALDTYMAMLTDTIMGFVPGVEGLMVYIDAKPVTELEAMQPEGGVGQAYDGPLLTRKNFAGYVGAPVTLYAAQDGSLLRVQRTAAQAYAADARERLYALMRLGEEGSSALPDGLTEEDVLAVHVSGELIAVNLSAGFAEKLQAMAQQEQRAAVYAMVNTLTEGTQASRAAFFFDGKQTQMSDSALEMRGSFMRNPGMVVN